MGTFIAWYLIRLVCGALIGLIPFGLGKYLNKPHWGQLGLILCAVSALIHAAIPLVAAVGFILAMLVCKQDLRWSGGSDVVTSGPVWQVPYQRSPGVRLICLAGPLKGQMYGIGSAGLTIGRDSGCTVRLPQDTPGISRCHCCIRCQRGGFFLVDLNSAYGTFQGNGTKLPSNYPAQLIPGSRFYLGTPNNLFEVRSC